MRRPRASGQENGECTALLAYGYPVVETLAVRRVTDGPPRASTSRKQF